MSQVGRPRKYATEEERYAAKRLGWARAREKRRAKWQPHKWAARVPTPPIVVPEAVLAERDRIMSQPETLGVMLLGEPPIGRRAIDRLHPSIQKDITIRG